MSTDIHTLAGAYALDAVTDIERAEFARHVAGCESCAQELAELRATVARLSDATSRAAPPHLKASVLAAVAQTRQLPPARDRDVREGAKRSPGWRRWAAAAAAAVVVAAGGGVAGYEISNSRVRDAQRAASAAEAQNAQINGVLTASDATVHTDRLPNGGQVTVVVSATLNEGVAVLSDMPALPGNRVYQLWLMYGQRAKSVGVMNPNVLAGTQLFAGLDGATTFAVSAEHAGGAPAPTLPAVTSLNL